MSVVQPGRLFANRFEIDRLAGSGGMGTVYRARDQYTGDWVALKLLHGGPDGIVDNERFTREAQLLSELRHPNIVSYVAHGQTRDGQRYLVMEWLEGEDLATRLQGGALSLADCERLFFGIAEGLSVTHQRGIVHRDRSHKTKIWLLSGHKALHRRRTDYACTPFPHCPS